MNSLKLSAAILASSITMISMPAHSHHNGTWSAPGIYTFEGPVQIRKNLPVWTNCTLQVRIKVNSLGHAKISSQLIGDFPCEDVTFSPYKADLIGAPGSVYIPGLQTDIPSIPTVPAIPADWCLGNLIALFDQTANPREIEFQDVLSDTAAGQPALPLPCRIVGTIEQTSGPGPLSWTP